MSKLRSYRLSGWVGHLLILHLVVFAYFILNAFVHTDSFFEPEPVAQTQEVVIFLTATEINSWSVPSDWNPDDNKIEVIGGGGGGLIGTQGQRGGPGGGGGAYAIIENVELTPGSNVGIQVGAGGAGSDVRENPAPAGGATFLCNSNSNCGDPNDSAVIVAAGGGAGGSGTTGGSGGTVSEGFGFSGGSGGHGATGNVNASGGGGGAGGPDGAGGDGDNSNEGSTGGDGNESQDGGGTGGSANEAGNDGDYWTETDTNEVAGPGGGGGGGSGNNSAGGSGGSYGGGGGGATSAPGGNGQQGVIVITYTPVDLIEPAFDAAEVTDTEPSQVRITFDADVTTTGTGDEGFSISSNGDAISIDSFNAIDGATVILNLDRDVVFGETLTVSYDAGTGTIVSSEDGSDAQSFTNQPVTNNVEAEAFYSRQTGLWNNTDSWSLTGHDGDDAGETPGPDNEIIIGDSHTITLNVEFALESTGSLTIDATGVLDFNSSGTLILDGVNVVGDGTFTLGSDGTLHIDSPDGITASAASGNIQTETRNYGEDANYIYNGSSSQDTGDGLPSTVNDLTIDNAENVTSTAGTDRTVNGTLFLVAGEFIMAEGTSLVTTSVNATGGGEVTMQVEISGNIGYRMITSPVGTGFADLLGGDFNTQGFTGSNFPNRQPNVLWYQETYEGEEGEPGPTANASWRTIDDLDVDLVTMGRGYFFYVFNGVDDYTDTLPIVMDASGVEPDFSGGVFDFGVTYTERASIEDEFDHLNGWNLVGNPTTATIDWDHGDWIRTNVDETYYVWDPSANTGDGDYLVWNSAGTGDNPNSGNISPFQAFWVKTNAADPVMSITHNVKNTGGDFVGDGVQGKTVQEPVAVELELYTSGMESRTFVSFMEEGKFGYDPYDAYRLQPFANTSYLSFFTTSGGDNDPPLVINNLPLDLDRQIRLPLQVGGIEEGKPLRGNFDLNWSIPENWPEDWTITLMDHEKKEAISMRGQDGYQFWYDTPKEVVPKSVSDAPATEIDLNMPDQIVSFERIGAPEMADGDVVPAKMSAGQAPRFTIVIDPAGDPGQTNYIPNEPVLLPNYPNPFNHSTTLVFALDEQRDITLDVYDILGRKVETVAKGRYSEGTHRYTWEPRNLAGGVYLYRLQSGRHILSEKMMYAK